METIAGVCYFCNSDDIVLSSEGTDLFLNKISQIFDGWDTKKVDTNIKVCPSCMFKTTLLESKKNVLVEASDIDSTQDVMNQCTFCENNVNVFRVKPSNLRYHKFDESQATLRICDGCYFAMDVAVKLRETLNHAANKFHEAEEHASHLNNNFSIGTPSLLIHDDLEHEPDINPSSTRNNENPIETERKFVTNFTDTFSKFSPLCETGIDLDENIKNDLKFFNYIPFVRIPSLQLSKKKNKVQNLIKTSKTLSRHSPPIKIKLKMKTKREKKIRKRFTNPIGKFKIKRTPHRNQEMNEFNHKKPIVKVTRMNFEDSQNSTPKKRKKVHFNDTPTIILNEPDDFDTININSDVELDDEICEPANGIADEVLVIDSNDENGSNKEEDTSVDKNSNNEPIQWTDENKSNIEHKDNEATKNQLGFVPLIDIVHETILDENVGIETDDLLGFPEFSSDSPQSL